MVLIDVGVRGGFHPRWHDWRGTLIGIDADPAGLPEPRGRMIAAALADTTGSRTLHLTRKRECSSLFHPNMAWLRQFPDADRFTVTDTRTVVCTTLDALAIDPEDGVILKLDAQGAEHAILSGASALLPHVALVEAETYFAPVYADAPLADATTTLLREQGLYPLTMRRYWDKDLQGVPWLVFADTIYGRIGHPALPTLLQRYRFTPTWPRWLRLLYRKGRATCHPFTGVLDSPFDEGADLDR